MRRNNRRGIIFPDVAKEEESLEGQGIDRSCKIGVVGAGVMGQGVAQRFATKGYIVQIYDSSEVVRGKIIDSIFRNLKYMQMMDKSIDANAIVGLIRPVSDMEELKDVDYLVENVTENVDVKRSVYRQLKMVCKQSCIFMANTSCIPITKLGAFTDRPSQVVGVHFMNPVPMKHFSEMIRGRYTSSETIESVQRLLCDIGISTEVINDSAGFVSNRLSHLFMNEAAFLVYEHVATAEQIDSIFRNAFGHKMGPLETADLIGLDTVLDSLRVLYEYYEDGKFRACPLLKQKADAGEYGRKSGAGFYQYK